MTGLEEKKTESRAGYATVYEVAEYLRVSPMSVYRLMGDGRLGFAKFGRARRIAWEEVERYAASCRSEPCNAEPQEACP